MMTNLNPVGHFPCSSAQAPGDPLLCRELMGSCTHAAALPELQVLQHQDCAYRPPCVKPGKLIQIRDFSTGRLGVLLS